jgi:hypothetical protein
MINVASAFSLSIAHDYLQLTELYEITLKNGDVYCKTPFDRVLSWDSPSQSYAPAVIFRGERGQNTNLESVGCDITIVDPVFVELAEKGALDGCQVTLKRIFWSETVYGATKQIEIPLGEADAEFDRISVVLHCSPLIFSLNHSIPKNTYQEPCNHCIFETDPNTGLPINCTLDHADYEYSGTATGGTRTTLIDTTRGTCYKVSFDAGNSATPVEIGDTITGGGGGGTAVVLDIVYSTATTGRLWYAEQAGVQFVNNEVLTGGGNTITVNGTPAEDNTYYAQGEVEMLTGDNAGHKRPILFDSAGTTTMQWPFPNTIVAGDTYKISPGCDKKALTCDEKFGNKPHFKGFIQSPQNKDVSQSRRAHMA